MSFPCLSAKVLLKSEFESNENDLSSQSIKHVVFDEAWILSGPTTKRATHPPTPT